MGPLWGNRRRATAETVQRPNDIPLVIGSDSCMNLFITLPRWQSVLLCDINLASRLCLKEMYEMNGERLQTRIRVNLLAFLHLGVHSPIKPCECLASNHISSHLVVVYRWARATPLGTTQVAVTPEPFSRPHEGS